MPPLYETLRLKLNVRERISYDIVELGDVTRVDVSHGELVALRASLIESYDADAPVEYERRVVPDKPATSFPALGAFFGDDKGREEALSQQAAEDEEVRAAWERWLRGAYLVLDVVQSPAFVDFFFEDNGDDGRVVGLSSSARTKRLVAEANMVRTAKERETLRATLKAKETEMAAALGVDEVEGANVSRSIAKLRSTRQSLESFAVRRASEVSARLERSAAAEAQRGRLHEEVKRSLEESARSLERAAVAKSRLASAEQASRARRADAGKRVVEASAAQRAAADRQTWLEEAMGRVRARVSSRTAERAAARLEADRAAAALANVSDVIRPKAQRDLDAALAHKSRCDDLLRTQRREAKARARGLAEDCQRRQDEHSAIQALARLLDDDPEAFAQNQLVGDLYEEDVATSPWMKHKKGALVLKAGFADDGGDDDACEGASFDDDDDDAATMANNAPAGGREKKAPPPPAAAAAAAAAATRSSSSTQHVRAAMLVTKYAKSAAAVDAAWEAAKAADARQKRDLEAELETAVGNVATLDRVLASALKRHRELERAAHVATREAACADAAFAAAAEERDGLEAQLKGTREALKKAEHLLDGANRALDTLEADLVRDETALRHALDADTSISQRHLVTLASCRDALAESSGDGAPAHVDLFPQVPDPEVPVVELARAEIARVDADLAKFEAAKKNVRSRMAERCATWEAESVALRAQLHGAEVQIRIFADDANNATQMQDDLDDEGASV